MSCRFLGARGGSAIGLFPTVPFAMVTRALAVSCVLAITVPPQALLAQTALDTYVNRADASYSWSIQNTIEYDGFNTYVVDLTSQTWRSSSEVDRSEWQHWLTVVVPDGAPIDTAMLLVGHGDNGGAAPGVDSQLAQAALATNSVMAMVQTVPNQPLQFSDEVSPRVEDEIIAYTFDKFLNGGDDEWPLLLPMVKSTVRAMDTIQTLVLNETAGATTVNKFTLHGPSKRGWTAWLTAAVDDRVSAIVPEVIDVLNFGPQFQHHKQFYDGVTDHIVGGYSSLLSPYIDFDLLDIFQTPEAASLLAIIDPYEYRDRYADIPKLMINATGDEFFVPDSSQLYFDDLPGQKYLRYKPNSGHSGDFELAALFHFAVANGDDLPEFSWVLEDDGRTIRVTSADVPTEVKMWEAHNPDARDFRHSISTPPPVWTSDILSEVVPGEYVAEVDFPESGATAFMVELTFASGYPLPFVFTTNVSIVDAVPEPADLNNDGSVDAADASILFTNWGTVPPADPIADINGDHVVDAADASELFTNWTGDDTAIVPEPATAVIMLIGVVGLAIHHRMSVC